MSDWLMDIAHYLNAGFDDLRMFSDGPNANLFINDLPDMPNKAVALFRYGGGAPDELFGNTFAARNPRMQAMIRDPYSEVSIDLAEQIMKYLGSIVEEQIGSTFFHRVKPVGEITELGPDSAKRERATVNFQVEIRGAG